MKIEAQGHLIKLIVGTTNLGVKGERSKRSKITSFSAASRKRLIEMLARFTEINKAVFITLTYGQKWPDNETAKRHLKNFLQRIRDKYPMASGVWRLEFQERGAPHYHLMLFNCPFWNKADVAAAWAKTINDEYCDWSSGQCRPPFTRIELIQNLKHALAYVSKYIAKDGKTRGRDECGFNYASYQQKSNFTGRFWGILNVEKLPYATRYSIVFSQRAVGDTFRFMAHFEKKMIKPFSDRGFTLFTDRLADWMLLIGDILGDNNFRFEVNER